MKPEAPVETLPCTLADLEEAWPLGETMNVVETKALVYTRVDTLLQEKTSRASEILRGVAAMKLVQALHETQPKAAGKNYW